MWSTQGQNWKNLLRKSKISFDMVNWASNPKIKPKAQMLRTPIKAQAQIKAQLLKPNPNWAPEIFKAHFEYAPATSKIHTDKWLSCPPEPGNTSVRFHEHNSNISNSIYIIIFL